MARTRRFTGYCYRVSTGEECSIIIEDGYVAGQDTVPTVEQIQHKTWKAGEF